VLAYPFSSSFAGVNNTEFAFFDFAATNTINNSFSPARGGIRHQPGADRALANNREKNAA
jgi:hypothetical protein